MGRAIRLSIQGGCALAAMNLVACSGELESGGTPEGLGMETLTPGPGPEADPLLDALNQCAASGLEANLPRWLNRAELNNMARDVFGVTSDPFNTLPNDQNAKTAGTSLTVTGAFAELYQTAALQVADEYIASSSPLAVCGGVPSADCLWGCSNRLPSACCVAH